MTSTRAELPLECFARHERDKPDRIFLTQPLGGGAVRDWTWREVGDEARRMASHLQAQGWEPGARIAILSKNCAHWIVSDLAILMAGFVSVPLYPTLTAHSVRQILEHSEARAMFVGKLDDWPAMKDGVPEGVRCIAFPVAPDGAFERWDDIIARSAPLAAFAARGADDLITIIYTSGTTGMPKGVMHSFGTFASAGDSGMQRFSSQPDDRVLSYLPLSHIAERGAVEMLSVRTGGRIFFAESLETFAADLRRARPHFFFSVPRLWVKFQQGVQARIPQKKLDLLLRIPIVRGIVSRKILAGLGLDQCRVAAGGAAPMPPDVLRWYQRLGLDVIEVYGMTENCGISHSTLPGQSRPGYVGIPYEGVESRLAPSGEVEMRSAAVMLGYYREPEKTREAMTEDGWLRTGDLGVLDEQGRLRLTGRAKELFKTSKGKYVSPAPIENRVNGHDAVEACCVMGAHREAPFVVVILAPDRRAACADPAQREALGASLQAHLGVVNAALDPHERLAFIVVSADAWTVDNGLVTPTLKVKRSQVEARYAPKVERWSAAQAPVVWDF
jgi:long-chain acyl-CoA synthetase